jgi:tetratricopeptide (TPR) repeat protein
MFRSTSQIIRTKIFLSFIFLGVVCQQSFTQQLDSEIDSLKNVLKTTGEDTNKVNVLNLISRKLVEATQNENPKDYAELALSLAKYLNFKPGIAFAYYNIGLFEGQRGRYTEAFSNFRKASGFYAALGDEGGLAAVAVISGFLHYRLRDYSEALKCYGASLRTFQKIKSIPGMSDVHRKLGVLYADQGIIQKPLSIT